MAIVKKLKGFTIAVVAGFNAATICIMILTAYADHLYPVSHPVLSVVGLCFPVLLIFNLLFLVFWLVFKWRMAWIPVLGYAICLPAIKVYMPLNPSSDVPEGALKVISYNVFSFGGNDGYKDILDFLARENADIVCMQEANAGVRTEEVDIILAKTYRYRDTFWHSGQGTNCVTLLSKYPILNHKRIQYDSESNLSAAWTVDVNGKKVIVINNHFESNKISDDEKAEFKRMIKGKLSNAETKIESRSLLRQLASAAKKRAPEVDSVAAYIKRHPGESIILCGDFNDSPLSYSRHKLASLLTDCYVATGFGPGISYHVGGMYVRIDNIMCSSDLQPYNAKVLNQISASDHYPICCLLKKDIKTKK